MKSAKFSENDYPFLTNVPQHWSIVPFRRLFSESSEVNGKLPAGPMLSISGYRGVEVKSYDSENRRRSAEEVSDYRVVRPGQLAVNTMWMNHGGLGVSDLLGHMSPAYRAYNISRALLPRYAHHLLRSPEWVSGYTARVTGIRPNSLQLTRHDLMSFPVLVPPKSEQLAIADYLDHETAEIDTFITELQALLDLSAEHLDSLWDTEFRSLQARHPEVKLRRVIRSLVDGPFGSALTSASYSDNGAPVVRLANIRRNSFAAEPRVYVPVDYAAQLASHDARPGDVVIAGLGDDNFPLGRAAVIPPHFGRGIVKADCYRARTSERISAAYLAWALSSPTMNAAFQIMGRGTTRARLNLNIVSAAAIPLPDRKTQENVVQAHEAESRAHGSMVESVNRAIDLARERRAALISAAVTGQIDVKQKHRPVAEQLEDEVQQLS